MFLGGGQIEFLVGLEEGHGGYVDSPGQGVALVCAVGCHGGGN